MITLDFEQYLGAFIMIIIVSIPIVIAALGPVIGGEKVNVRDLRPLLIEACKEFQYLKELEDKSYEELEDEVVAQLAKDVQNMSQFTQDEKSLLHSDIIRILIRPYLQKVFKQK